MNDLDQVPEELWDAMELSRKGGSKIKAAWLYFNGLRKIKFK
jgi:hypothetical protein